MLKGKVTIKAYLHTPEDVWETTQPVEYPAGAEKSIILQMLFGVKQSGLVRPLDDGGVELIAEHRVIRYTAHLSTIALADNLDLADLNARRGGKISLA